MSFFAGAVGIDEGRCFQAWAARLDSIAATHGVGGKPSTWRGPQAALVHVLRVVTPEDRFDKFPVRFAGGHSVLVFDGRLDNRNDLIEALAIDRRRAAALGDGGLAIAALERWGDEACQRLVGDFAFAWWDQTARQLLLAADAVGGRTIYAHAGGNGLCFATRPMAVLGFPDVPREVDDKAMAYPLLMRQMPAGLTPFRGVFRLPPAGRLIWRNGHYTIDRYWRPDPGRRIRYRDEGQYVESARELLDRVVKEQLRAQGPVVSQLSAGLDSSAVAATAARLMAPGLLHTLTSLPDPAANLPGQPANAIYDECPLALATAALHPNIVPHLVPAGPLTAGERDGTRLFFHFGFPVRNFTNFGAFQPLYAKARELGATVVLTGAAGNATLSWQSAALLADLAASGRFIALGRQLYGLKRHGYPLQQEIRGRLLKYLLPSQARRLWRQSRGRPAIDWAEHSAATATFAAAVDAAKIRRQPRIRIDRPHRDQRVRIDFLEQYWAWRPWLDAHPAVTGCELRDPLCDRRMVEFCLALPSEIWQADGMPRSFVRKVIADRVPAAVRDNPARGYQNADWFHRVTGLRETFMAELDRLEASPAARRMIDLPRLKGLAARWPDGPDAAQAQIGDYLAVFARGVHYGRFIRWVEGSNG